MALVDYDSSGDENEHANTQPVEAGLESQMLMTAAPQVTNLSVVKSGANHTPDGPMVGPEYPFESTRKRKVLAGEAEEEAFSNAAFKVQNRNWEMMGYAQDPSSNQRQIVGDQTKALENYGRSVTDFRAISKDKREIKSKRQKKGDASVLEGENAYKGPWAKYQVSDSSSSEEEAEEEGEEQEQAAPEIPAANSESEGETEPAEIEETTEFCGSQEVDYLGRTYMHIPQDLDIKLDKEPGTQDWYIPKKKIHTFSGHDGGCTKVKFFPRTGHLLLTGGNDNKIKLWDVYHDRELLRVFIGHVKPIKDLDFSPDGKQILSTSLDRTIKLWDTETGRCLNKWYPQTVANCVRFSPIDPTSFIVGCNDNRILQYSTDSSEAVYEYNQHIKPVRTITFVEKEHNEGEGGGDTESTVRFVSTSMDKSIRVWELQNSLPVKLLTDPTQLAMPAVVLHPSGKHFAAQSVDHKIVIYSTSDRFRRNKKKLFTGFTDSGLALGLDFSPDGRYLIAADASGTLHFWNWKTCGSVQKLKAHNKPAYTVAAHPQETSKVVSAGLDGSIQLWD